MDRHLLEIPHVLMAFPYGSHVYGINREDSDKDFIVVVEQAATLPLLPEDYDVSVYTLLDFERGVNEHDIAFLECLSLSPESWAVRNIAYDMPDINLPVLRKSISAKANNSWVKCKKKLTVEENQELIGKKSLFHSLRIIKFGIQLATQGFVVNFQDGKELYDDIINGPNDWEFYSDNYKTLHNDLMTQFRKVAPKE